MFQIEVKKAEIKIGSVVEATRRGKSYTVTVFNIFDNGIFDAYENNGCLMEFQSKNITKIIK
ncbi:MAG: hypothetical protein HC892_09995 [Saprospiraceae bacterium]|nr:hypothetical protein [Saprospiraceae bacterium]